jgi:nucleoside-diphosphate-sugar epimerase
MHVVVTGATGNVGTSVVTALLAHPDVDRVSGIARRRPRRSPPGARYVEADVREDDLVALFEGADAVIHLAWWFQPTHDPAATWMANAVGSSRVFEAAAAARVRALVHASSVGVYARRPADDHPVDESWPSVATNSTAAYGREKAYAERALDAVEASSPDLRVVRLRPAFTFKRSASSEQRRIFLGRLVPRGIMAPGRLPILPLPRGLRLNAVHTDDVADAYVRAATSDVRGPFNIAADDVLGAADVARALGTKALELPRPLVRTAMAAAWHGRVLPAAPELLDMAMEVPLMATDRAREVLGWQPIRSASSAVAEAAEGMAAGAGAPTVPLEPDSHEAA